ncbi:hypothetical protein GUITHDRAFT_154638, partial [Guillardia theta CCMP2712]
MAQKFVADGNNGGPGEISAAPHDKHIRAAFDATISALCRRRDIARVNQVVETMVNCKVEPSSSTIAALARIMPLDSTGEILAVNHQHTKGANQLNLTLIRNFSKHLFNNVEARNAMLSRAASSSVTELELLWQKLLQDSWEPDICSFNILLATYARLRDVERAWMTFELIKEKRLVPTESTCVSMIVAHSKLKRQDQAAFRVVEFVQEMKRMKIDHTVKTAAALIRVYGQLGLCDQALMVLD